MAKISVLSAVVILSAAVATPVFAESAHHVRAYHHRNFHAAYNHLNATFYAYPEIRGRNIVNFGLGGRDPSYPGGEDPSDHPSD